MGSSSELEDDCQQGKFFLVPKQAILVISRLAKTCSAVGPVYLWLRSNRMQKTLQTKFSQQTIARDLMLNKSAVSRAVSALENAGLIQFHYRGGVNGGNSVISFPPPSDTFSHMQPGAAPVALGEQPISDVQHDSHICNSLGKKQNDFNTNNNKPAAATSKEEIDAARRLFAAGLRDTTRVNALADHIGICLGYVQRLGVRACDSHIKALEHKASRSTVTNRGGLLRHILDTEPLVETKPSLTVEQRQENRARAAEREREREKSS
jgi:hypothetical protein